jgi:hypothetical protein
VKRLQSFYPDRAVRLWWPIKLRWIKGGNHTFICTHWFAVGSERCSDDETSGRCCPGYREVFGWTLHIGNLKVIFGSVPWMDPQPEEVKP